MTPHTEPQSEPKRQNNVSVSDQTILTIVTILGGTAAAGNLPISVVLVLALWILFRE